MMERDTQISVGREFPNVGAIAQKAISFDPIHLASDVGIPETGPLKITVMVGQVNKGITSP